MNLMRTTKPSFNRRALATQAMQAAAATRAKAKLDQARPICIYGLCEMLGVAVRFAAASKSADSALCQGVRI